MYHFRYVSKNEIAPLKNQVIELIGLVQDEIRKYFTFQYEFIGSVKRNMVTCDAKSNIGFDFDVNIMVNDDDEDYSAKEIKQILMKAFNKYAYKYHYDFLLNRQEYIRFNKKSNSYNWVEQSNGFYLLPEKVEFCKDNYLWTEVREIYIEKKNCNTDKNKKSRSIFADAIHQVCQQNGYFEE